MFQMSGLCKFWGSWKVAVYCYFPKDLSQDFSAECRKWHSLGQNLKVELLCEGAQFFIGYPQVVLCKRDIGLVEFEHDQIERHATFVGKVAPGLSQRVGAIVARQTDCLAQCRHDAPGLDACQCPTIIRAVTSAGEESEVVRIGQYIGVGFQVFFQYLMNAPINKQFDQLFGLAR